MIVCLLFLLLLCLPRFFCSFLLLLLPGFVVDDVASAAPGGTNSFARTVGSPEEDVLALLPAAETPSCFLPASVFLLTCVLHALRPVASAVASAQPFFDDGGSIVCLPTASFRLLALRAVLLQ